MKKILFSMFAVAGMLFATSCQNDELVQEPGGEAQVSFTIGVEGDLNTRAISDGTKADRLVYAVFDAQGNRLTDIAAVDKTVTGFPVTETINLAKGRTYRIAFWAQDTDCEAYTVDTDDMTVAVNYKDLEGNNAPNNDETRDAFFASKEITVNGNLVQEIVLRRALAQVNLGVTEEDVEAATNSGFEVKDVEVTIGKAANKINLLTGVVEGEETVTYAATKLETPEMLAANIDMDPQDGQDITERKEFVWLSMCYFLVNETSQVDDDNDGMLGDAKASTSIKLVVNPTGPTNAIILDESNGLADVPVRRNWRTNIVGSNILTGNVSLVIDLDPAFEGEHNENKGNIETSLEANIANGGPVYLTGNFTMPTQFEVYNDVELYGNGNTLTSKTGRYVFVLYKGKVTVNDLHIATKNGGVGVASEDGAELVYNSGSIKYVDVATDVVQEPQRYCFYAQDNSKITVNGGDFQINSDIASGKRYYVYAADGSTIIINGGNFGTPAKVATNLGPINAAGTGRVIINGGTFKFDPSAFVAETSTVVEENGVWTVTPNA